MKYVIGNTPMVKIYYKYNGNTNYIYSKLEYYNLTGSIKDRVIFYIINKAYEDKILKSGMGLVEATSGNTGISLSAIGAYYNHPVKIFMPDWVSEERIKIMQLYGADVTLISKEEGGFEKCIELSNQYAKKHNAFLTDQFNNKYNVEAHYNSTGMEISKYDIDAFISGIGTGGTLMGIGKRLKEVKNAVIFAIEPAEMSLLKEKNIGFHKVEGIGDDFIPNIVDKSEIKDVFLIKSDDAINMSKMLARIGIGVGISSGANMLGSILVKELGYNNVATVFPDDFKKYLSTDLTKKIDIKDDFISNKIELIKFEVV